MQGSGSGDDVKQPEYKGVRDYRRVEITPLVEGVNFIQDVTGMSLQQAAMAHDLVRAYANPHNLALEKLNIQKLVDEIATLGPSPYKDDLKEFLAAFVLRHPLTKPRVDAREWVDSVKHDIVVLAKPAFETLEEWIVEGRSRAGRQRQDLDDFLPVVQGDPLEESEGEYQLLMKAEEADEFKLRRLLIMLCAPPGSPDPEFNLTDLHKHLLKEIQRLEALLEAKDAEIASVKAAMDAGAGAGVSSGCELTCVSGLVSSMDWFLSSPDFKTI